MTKLRFGKRFKRFKKQQQQQQNVVVVGTNNSTGPNNGGDDDARSIHSEASNGGHGNTTDSSSNSSPGILTIATSDESTTSSLNSDLSRSYGPIDVDTCRKAKSIKFGRRRSSSRERGTTSLPKIAESPHGSRATTPVSTQHQKQQDSPTDSVLTDDYEQSPGAQTVTTINGKDVFERSRSAISVQPTIEKKEEDTLTTINNNGSSLQSSSNTKPPLGKPTTTMKSSRTESPDATVATASTKSTTSSSKSVRAISPFLSSLSKPFKRDRASTPNSTSTDEMLCQAEVELDDGPHFLVEGSPLADNNNNNSGGSINGGDSSRTPTRKNKSQQQEVGGPSPISVIHMFNSTTQDDVKYAVEIDPIGSQQQDDTTTNDKTGKGGNNERYSTSNHHTTECKDEKYLAQGMVSPPKIHRRPSPTKLFGSGTNSVTKFWDAMTYTSLEDAIATHHAALIGNNVEAEGAASVSVSSKDGVSKAGSKDGGSVSSKNLTGSNKGTNKSSDFLALKKDAEKNEFKKVQAIAGLTNKSKNENKGSGNMVILPPSNKDASTTSNKDVVSPRKGVGEKKTPQEDPQEKKKNWTLGMGWKSSSSNKKDVDMDPPPPSLMDASTSIRSSTTRSASPSTIVITEVTRTIEPASPDPFVQDVLVGTPPAAAGGTAPVVSTFESFSFDNNFLSDMGMEQPKLDDSLSDDSYSCLSELESIGEITICEETERLLEAHKMYHDSAKVNMNHPARRKPSIMRVGSVYKSINKAQKAVEVTLVESGSKECSIHTERGSLSSKSNSIQRNATADKKQKVKLSWYDDEANWNKPFTLRTDESFESSTLTSGNSKTTSGMRLSGPLAMNQFFGEFIKGIGGFAGGCGGEMEDVASFDVGDQQEI